jgi:hypothetical protein
VIRHARSGLAAVAIAMVLAGCSGGPRPDPAPFEGPVSLAELVARARVRSDAAQSLGAALGLTWTPAGGGEAGDCSASLAYRQPAALRLEGRTAAFFRVFTLAADADSVRLDVPREELFVAGARGDPAWAELFFPPDRLLVAMLADPWAGNAPDTTGLRRREEPGPALIGPDWTLAFDPRTGLPRRYETGDLVVEWSDWAVRWGLPWPHTIVLEGPSGMLEARLGRIRMNEPVADGAFTLAPPGSTLPITPDQVQFSWERQFQP